MLKWENNVKTNFHWALRSEIQYRYSIHAPLDRTFVITWLDKHQCITYQQISYAHQ